MVLLSFFKTYVLAEMSPYRCEARHLVSRDTGGTLFASAFAVLGSLLGMA